MEEEVVLKAKVPIQEYERFRSYFPQYGAVTWFMQTALRRFNDEVEKSPSAIERVDDAIAEMLVLNKKRSELKKELQQALGEAKEAE